MGTSRMRYCSKCWTDLPDGWSDCQCWPEAPTIWQETNDFVVRKIPFYEGKHVQKIIGGGRLRGRGSRTGFKNPQSPYHKCMDGTYKMSESQLSHSLPHHLSTSFTLYHTRGGYSKTYTDYQGFRDGKLVLRLQV